MAYFVLYLVTGFATTSYSVYKVPPKSIDFRDSGDSAMMALAYMLMVFFWPAFLLIDLVSIWIKYLIRRGNERKEKQRKEKQGY